MDVGAAVVDGATVTGTPFTLSVVGQTGEGTATISNNQATLSFTKPIALIPARIFVFALSNVSNTQMTVQLKSATF